MKFGGGDGVEGKGRRCRRKGATEVVGDGDGGGGNYCKETKQWMKWLQVNLGAALALIQLVATWTAKDKEPLKENITSKT